MIPGTGSWNSEISTFFNTRKKRSHVFCAPSFILIILKTISIERFRNYRQKKITRYLLADKISRFIQEKSHIFFFVAIVVCWIGNDPTWRTSAVCSANVKKKQRINAMIRRGCIYFLAAVPSSLDEVRCLTSPQEKQNVTDKMDAYISTMGRWGQPV